MLNVWCDGSITGSHWAKKGNKDSLPHAWSGWVAKKLDGEYVHHHSLDLGEGTLMSANVAEYMAVRSALRWLALNHRGHAIHIMSDSQLVMRQLTGEYNCHNEHLQKFRANVLVLAALFPQVTYEWIRREKNREADVLSKGFQIWGRIPTWDEVQAMVNG